MMLPSGRLVEPGRRCFTDSCGRDGRGGMGRLIVKSAVFAALGLIGLGLAGCADKRGGPIPYNVSSFGAPDAPQIVALEAGYKIAPMDTLSVKVFRMPDLTGDYEVDLAGHISMPLIMAGLGQTSYSGQNCRPSNCIPSSTTASTVMPCARLPPATMCRRRYRSSNISTSFPRRAS